MELLNTISKAARSDEGIERSTLDEALDTLALLLAPMAPHITAELWEKRYPERPSVHMMPWPIADPALVAASEVTMVVQVNGKVKARLQVRPPSAKQTPRRWRSRTTPSSKHSTVPARRASWRARRVW